MKYNLTPEWGELDQIDAAHGAAETIEQYEQADAAFYAINPDIRAGWVASELRVAGLSLAD